MDYPNSITLDRLRYFTKVAELEHVGRAAKILNVTPSVISSAVKTLEEELGHMLFYREKQRIKLTEKGRELLELALKIINSTAELKSKLNSETPTLAGHYRIGASHFLMGKFLVQVLSELVGEYPSLTFELSSLDTGVAISKVQAGLLDFALLFRSSYKEKILEEILWSGDFQIALKKDHRILKNRTDNRLKKLNGYPAISFRTSTGGNFWELHPALTNAGLIPNNSFFYDDTETAIKLLDATSGWAFLPEIIVLSDSRLKPFPLKNKLKAPVNISLVRNESGRNKNFGSVLIKKLQFAITGR